MASTKFKKRDLNRFRKVYPYIRRAPRPSYVADKLVIVEIGSIVFTNSSEGSHTFSESFTLAPIVTGIPFDSNSNHSADVNIFISAVDKNSFTFKTSQAFTGEIHFHAIQVGQ